MPHKLWNTHEWSTATEEQVIQALFDAPEFIYPFDMSEIQLHHPMAKSRYLNLFYSGQIPQEIKKLHKI